MLLVTDIGNTNIVLGGIENDQILFEARIATDRNKTSDQYGTAILQALSLFDVAPEQICGCIISSVVPPVLNAVRTGLVKIIGKQPLVVGPGIKTGLNIRVDNPSQLGSDRIVIAVAALELYQPPLILLDFGTATTIEVVNRDHAYVGGCIMPGVGTSLDALIARTAQLPGISLEAPQKVIGNNTVECIRSGVLCGGAAMVDGMIQRLEEELGEPAAVIATGGMARFVVPLCRHPIQIEENLLLQGLNLLYKKNTRGHC